MQQLNAEKLQCEQKVEHCNIIIKAHKPDSTDEFKLGAQRDLKAATAKIEEIDERQMHLSRPPIKLGKIAA